MKATREKIKTLAGAVIFEASAEEIDASFEVVGDRPKGIHLRAVTDDNAPHCGGI